MMEEEQLPLEGFAQPEGEKQPYPWRAPYKSSGVAMPKRRLGAGETTLPSQSPVWGWCRDLPWGSLGWGEVQSPTLRETSLRKVAVLPLGSHV